ncbi:Cytochrome c heme lyase subunit CcmL [Rubellimicrobium mesophilum DSM 19309]|uniref:Cytochrome c-type biogenesis protein n=1 Tax=Rubellimicrobium mesophilum DSM 19309 TaxID=442562 RepID=A0A017HR70_9RHOB|nr:cytochrome c-type biogenesis protein [Rubellimicrobium mesophilum]EYD76259.1 Cytochrome c heme lyase subunit CcmL [Rubellimicrobium mesophilum DSM 19309]
MKGLLLALLLLPTAALAVEPGEQLADPALETRARDISEGLRCPVCRNESIDESHAEVARDIRLFVRERLLAGDTDDQVQAAVVARYGEYVLLKPTAEGANLVLWLAAPTLLLAGLGLGWSVVRRRSTAPDVSDLTAEERARLDDLLGR